MFSCYFFSKKDNLNLNNNIFFITNKGRMSCFLGFLPDIFFYVIIKSSLLILTFFVFFFCASGFRVYLSTWAWLFKKQICRLIWTGGHAIMEQACHKTGQSLRYRTYSFALFCLFYSWTIQSGVLVCISLGKFFLLKFD